MRFENIAFEFAAWDVNSLPKSTLPEIVFSGRSNVGKSSLINKLTNRKSIARVSSSPGKTGTINFYNLKELRFVDLPGYGYAKVSFNDKKRWAKLVEGYFNSNRNIRLVIQIIDMRHKPSNDDMNMINYLHTSNIPFIIALTKSDKLNKTNYNNMLNTLTEILKKYKSKTIIPFSAVSGIGMDTIKDEILSCLATN